MHDQPLILQVAAPGRKLGAQLVASPLRTIGWCIVEARPQVLAIFGLRFAVGAVLGWPPAGGHFLRAGATALVWEFAVFFVYLFNGVADVREDRLNGSTRPIARGALEPAAAVVVASGTALVAVLGGLAIGGPTAWLVPLLLALGYLYSGPPFYLKRRSASTAAIGMAGGLLSYFAGLTSPAPLTTTHATATLAVFAVSASLWMGLVGTLAKDLPDVAGDTVAGRNSAVAHLGDAKARSILSSTAITIAVAFNLVAVAGSRSLCASAIAMLAGAVVLTAVTRSARSRGSRPNRRRPYRVFMLTQYSTHLCILALALWHVAFAA